ncbi:MAG: hypothetical protein HYU80_03935 [Candidatus Blackburnbacteria bacterium]|nr:hypothetical protein [Candidatus Blackburnbacteria bacterium]
MAKLLSLLILFFVLITGLSVLYGKKSLPLSLRPTPVSVVTPSPTPVLPKVVDTIAPDMKQTLIMKEEQSGNSVTHTFLTQGEKDETAKQIFAKTVNLPQTITIPFNTWSPGGNKYLFLKETSEGENSYIVIALEKLFSSNLQSVNVGEMFMKKYSDYKITDVTGWAAPTLLVVNTDNMDGTVGPSFWLDVSSLSFIKLSTRFN